jgi:dinuclear metal center YbgI/SA1388 family protein
MITIKELTEYIGKTVSPKLAYKWDNSGLLIGEPDMPIERILITLDITAEVVDHAIEKDIDLIFSHHPLFIKPITKLNNPLILKLIRHNISVYSAHTNMDIYSNGVNRALADVLGVQNCSFLSQETDVVLYHIAVYIPPGNVEKVSEAIFEAGGGKIGNYSHCGNTYQVQGQFKPLSGSDPTIGSVDKLEKVDELKLEFFADSTNLDRVIKAMVEAHPYETPAYAVYEQHKKDENYGLGLIGEMDKPAKISDFASIVKKGLNIPKLSLWLADKDIDDEIRKVALCGGGGSSLIKTARAKGAEIFVTADIGYHHYLESDIPLIDAGHYYTEYPFVNKVGKLLKDLSVELEIYPFHKHRYVRNFLIL